ncbi:MAG: hypothetical protein JWM99_2964, partial [Verrucomicrobiales bacterium]|nr:hypothetical protein [Verrucomicrobiales bacterium]
MAFNYSLGVDPLSSSIRTLAPPSSRAMRKLSKEREFILYWVTRRATFEPPRCLSHCSRRSSLTSPAARAAPTEVFPLAGSGYRMICENFEWFNDSPVELPVRSRQNPLPPIGRGTGLAQSLPSHIHHVAASHSLPTWTLVCRIIAPEFRRKTVATTHGHCDLFGNMGA